MWNLSSEKRLAAWKNFRKDISELTLLEALQRVANEWAAVPFTPHPNESLDVRNPNIWPSAWDLIIKQRFCELSRTLGMLYTLYYSTNPNLKSLVIKHGLQDGTVNYTLLIVNDTYVLNYKDGEVISSLPDNFVTEFEYEYDLSNEKFCLKT